MCIDGYQIRPAEVTQRWLDHDQANIQITIHEGRNRQIRKMAEKCGMCVTRLKRIAEGNLYLGDLKKGSWRYLTKNELEGLYKL